MLSKIKSYITASPNNDVLPVAVISLDDHLERRIKIQQKGMPSEWTKNYWPAADFRNANNVDIAKNTHLAGLETHLGRRVRPGEVGCALSHHNVACWLADSQHDLMLILEDDTVPLTPTFEQLVLSVANTLGEHAKSGAAFICLLSLDMKFVRNAYKRRVCSRLKQPSLQGIELFLHSDPDYRIWRSHAYLISRGAAARTQRHETKILTLTDDWQHRRSLGLIDRIFYSNPVVFGLCDGLESSIDPEGSRKQAMLAGNPSRILAKNGSSILSTSYLFSKFHRRLRRTFAQLISPFPCYV